jgi:hypothetical protein
MVSRYFNQQLVVGVYKFLSIYAMLFSEDIRLRNQLKNYTATVSCTRRARLHIVHNLHNASVDFFTRWHYTSCALGSEHKQGNTKKKNPAAHH